MRVLLSLLTLLIFSIPVFANEIDNLKTADDVNAFLSKRFHKYNWLSVDENDVAVTKYGKNKFYKLDLDGNGLTDLVVDGSYLFAVTNANTDKYEYHAIDHGAFSLARYSLVNILHNDKVPRLVIRGYDERTKTLGGIETERTLVLKFGEFIEHDPKPDLFRIEKIVFREGGCFGDCPIFDMTISRDRSVYYQAIKFNDQQGKFTSTLDPPAFNRLAQTVNYMGLTGLKDRYEVPWTDDAGADLEITFDHGKVKKIHDYGLIGTFGLANLYSQLFDLRNSQKWSRIPGK